MKQERRNVHDEKRPSTSMLHHSQETVQALTDALLELQMELRNRYHECEGLRATVEALSRELRTSDSSLQEAELRAEKLDFRLQAVSYYYQSDLEASEEAERMDLSSKESNGDKKLLAADKESKKSKKKKKSKSIKKEKSERKSKVEKKKDKKRKTSRSKAEIEPPGEAECRDDINSDPRPEPEAEADAEPEASSIFPRQTTFQSALWERDQARAHVRELTDLLEERQSQCITLTNRLDCMTALVELAKQGESRSKDVLDANANIKRGFTWGTKQGVSGVDSDVATYRKNIEKSRSQRIVSCPSSPDRAAGLQ